MPAKKKLLTKKEIPSYQLAHRCLSFLDERQRLKMRGLRGVKLIELAKELAAEIRAYRAEERRVN